MRNSYRIKSWAKEIIAVVLASLALVSVTLVIKYLVWGPPKDQSGLLLCAYPGNTMRFEYKAIEFESDYRIRMITKEGKTMRIVIPPIATCVAAENVEMSVTPSTPSKAPDIST